MFIYLDMGGEAGSVRGRGDRERPRFPPSCAAGSHLRLQQVGDGDGDGDSDGDGDGDGDGNDKRTHLSLACELC